MLSRTPALRATRSRPSGLFPPSRSQSLQHLRNKATTRRFSTTAEPNRAHSLTSGRFSRRKSIGHKAGSVTIGKRYNSSATNEPENEPEHSAEPNEIYDLIEKIGATEAEILELLDDLDLTDVYAVDETLPDGEADADPSEIPEYAEPETPEEKVQLARQLFKERLPEGFLSEEGTLLYTRLYGEPIVVPEVAEEPEADQLFRDTGTGVWEEVDFDDVQTQQAGDVVYDMDSPPEDETDVMRRSREVAEQLGAEIMLDAVEDEEGEGVTPRHHPLTTEGKFATDPRTVFLPKDIKEPISIMLREANKQHLKETARTLFGGQYLPQSTSVALPRHQEPQRAVALSSAQRYMSNMEANAYLAVLYPGMYASVLSVLTEIRKRLGPEWLRKLISKEDGPNVLDAGAGGAGILAWRDVLRAEYELMVPDHPRSNPYPLGRSTVLTGSDPLRHRASAMLENTTFLPRLPDYSRTRERPTLDDPRPVKRKQFDLILAPHTLMNFDEDYQRKDYVENLWQMLNPNGGVLVLLEKGHQKGFEAVAGAREMLLKRYISSPGSTEYEDFLESAGENTTVLKEPGMIIAPCTNHEKCPMYLSDGHNKGRRDYCHFAQRYVRPTFHQNIIGAGRENHEDLKFSYVAVQRGVDLRQTEGITQGPQARDAAFEGYEHVKEPIEADEADVAKAADRPSEAKETKAEATDTKPAGADSDAVFTLDTPTQQAPEQDQEINFHTLSLPRLVYQPMKRRGHVIMDMCTPAGKIERWTVPRSFSKQAFKDARKAAWGDLWALGAKTSIPRNLKLGEKGGEGKKERLARRAAAKQDMEDDAEVMEDEEEDMENVRPPLDIPKRRKGQKKVPSWKKNEDQKKFRRASKQEARRSLE
ncbi:mitochondrial small ribosomal subunit Rsm22-domain-containing protein [Aspergillus unguis]